jgi:PEP-CTERM motif
MRALKIMMAGASLAVVLPIQAQAQTQPLISYTFAGNGTGCNGDCGFPRPAPFDGGFIGTFALDPALVTTDASGASVFTLSMNDFLRGPTQLNASSFGNTLNFSYSAFNSARVTSNYNVSLTFLDGTLGSVFPTSFDFANVISSSFTASDNANFVSGGTLQRLSGPLLFAGATIVQSTSSGFGRFEFNSGVPEPSTWLMMLFGFGAIGYSVRRRHAQTGIAVA